MRAEHESPPDGDWYTSSLDELQRCSADLHAALDRINDLFRTARKERIDGAPISEIVASLADRGGVEARRSIDDAYRGWTAALTRYRAVAIRALVDEEGMTLSEVARLTKVSRQMVGRLYRMSGADADGEPRPPEDA